MAGLTEAAGLAEAAGLTGLDLGLCEVQSTDTVAVLFLVAVL